MKDFSEGAIVTYNGPMCLDQYDSEEMIVPLTKLEKFLNKQKQQKIESRTLKRKGQNNEQE